MAQVLSGKEASAQIRENLKTKVSNLIKNGDQFRPGLKIVQVFLLY